MAKKGDNWLGGMMRTPSRKQYMAWLRSQRGQFAPIIGTLKDQIAAMNPEKDASVMAFNEALGRLPGSEQISGAYKGAGERIASAIANVDTSMAGKGVQDVIAALGGTPDVAQAAGTVSGVGTGFGNVINQALTQGALSGLAGLEAQRLSDVEGARRELTLGKGQAASAAKSQQRELARMLAQTKQQRAAATPNPFDLANMALTFRGNQIDLLESLKDLNKSGSGSGGTSKKKKERNPVVGGLTPEQEAAIAGASATSWLQGAGSNMFS